MKRGGNKPTVPDPIVTAPTPNDTRNILNKSAVRQYLKAKSRGKQITSEYLQELEAAVYREMRRSIIRANNSKQLMAEHIGL